MTRADMNKEPDEVAEMFDGVAKGYDRTNLLLSAGNAPLWRYQLVRALHPGAGEKILDLAAGTGTSAAAIAASGATVVAADFSEGMLDVGRHKHADKENLSFVHADAMNLPFNSFEFDAVTISFGLRNVADPKKALAEMFRVTKPGGRIIICEFSTPPGGLTRAAYNAYLHIGMPALAKLSSTNSDAYTYLAESIEAWPLQSELAAWMREAGYGNVAYKNLNRGIVALHRGTKPRTQGE